MAYGLAIAGHLIIALILLLGFFERTEPAPVAAMPVEIVMEEPAAASPPPVSTPNERSSLPNVPSRRRRRQARQGAAAQWTSMVSIGRSSQDKMAATRARVRTAPMPRAAGDLASGVSLPSWAVEPIGLAQQQATARESGRRRIDGHQGAEA